MILVCPADLPVKTNDIFALQGHVGDCRVANDNMMNGAAQFDDLGFINLSTLMGAADRAGGKQAQRKNRKQGGDDQSFHDHQAFDILKMHF